MEREISVNDQTFTIVRMLGKGKGGYSYLVTDGKKEYVVKQIHHEPCAYYEFGDKLAAEEGDYKKLMECGIPIPKMLDVDRKEERILKEYIKGDTIYDYIIKDAMRKCFYEQIVKICEKVTKRGINIDYFPTNFIVLEDKLWYIDYECNEYMEEWNYENWGRKYWSKTKAFKEYVRKQNQEKENIDID